MIHSKLPNIGTTIFTVMSSLAQQHNAVNLGQGFPDFSMDEGLIDCVNVAMRSNHNQYTHMNGYPLLREKIADKIYKLYGNKISFESDITITPGATYAIFTAISTIVNEGDEVIAFEPAYDCYKPTVELNKGKYIPIELNENFSIPWEKVKEKINHKTKAIIINTPHNPSGYVWTMEDIEQLDTLTKDTNIIIISDEVYEHLIFDNRFHESVLKHKRLYDRSFVCFSFGKTYHCTGWKIGYVIANPNLMKEFRTIHQFNAFCVDTPKQYALASYIENENAYLNLGKEVQKKRDYFRKLMSNTSFKLIPSQGSYFECYSFENISHKNDKDFAIELVSEYGIAAIPLSSFYTNETNSKILRFCFAKKEETLEKAAEKLMRVQ